MKKVKDELVQRSKTTDQVAIIEQYLHISRSNHSKLEHVRSLPISPAGGSAAEGGEGGLAELNFILQKSSSTIPLIIDFTLARGLNYYTGIIFSKSTGIS